GVAPGADVVQRERAGVEPPRRRPLVARQVRILSGDDVRAILSAAGVGAIGADVGRAREAARRVEDRAHLPAAEDGRADAALEERLAGAEGQLVEDGGDVL